MGGRIEMKGVHDIGDAGDWVVGRQVNILVPMGAADKDDVSNPIDVDDESFWAGPAGAGFGGLVLSVGMRY